jgi:hypothetical protein
MLRPTIRKGKIGLTRLGSFGDSQYLKKDLKDGTAFQTAPIGYGLSAIDYAPRSLRRLGARVNRCSAEDADGFSNKDDNDRPYNGKNNTCWMKRRSICGLGE